MLQGYDCQLAITKRVTLEIDMQNALGINTPWALMGWGLGGALQYVSRLPRR